MKHAGPEALRQLAPLLEELRRREMLTERSPGVFYRRSRAFLHFHEEGSGLFADLKIGDQFKRFAVGASAASGRALLREVDAVLACAPGVRAQRRSA